MAKKKKTIDWQNRIVDYGEMPADQFLAHELNARRHPGQQRDALRGSLNAVGWIAPVIVSKRTGKLLDGHARIEEALTKDESALVPFVSVDVDEAEEALILGTFDPITNQATYDREALDGLLRQIETSESGLQQLLADLAAKNDLYLTDEKGAGGEPQDAEPQVDKAAELNKKWKVKTGDLWLIGDHRLLCGDSTKAEDVARVMNGKKAELAAVDPPYNVGILYDGETVNDKKTQENYKAFSVAWFEQCQAYSDRQIITPGCNNLASWCRWFDPYHIAPWTKTNSMTNGKVSRFWCWEPVFFFGDKWQRSRSNDIFDFPIGQQKDIANHPCPKPLKMWADLIESYTEADALIYESFGGSGTSLVAAQNLGRKCFALEISPDYCAVILERMATTFPSLTIKREGEKPAKSKKR